MPLLASKKPSLLNPATALRTSPECKFRLRPFLAKSGERDQKITFGEMRESGVSRVIVFCSDYRCSHSTALAANRWRDHLRLSDIEPQFVCKACGKRGEDVRPDFQSSRRARI